VRRENRDPLSQKRACLGIFRTVRAANAKARRARDLRQRRHTDATDANEKNAAAMTEHLTDALISVVRVLQCHIHTPFCTVYDVFYRHVTKSTTTVFHFLEISQKYTVMFE
jgi:hypothetical protein